MTDKIDDNKIKTEFELKEKLKSIFNLPNNFEYHNGLFWTNVDYRVNDIECDDAERIKLPDNIHFKLIKSFKKSGYDVEQTKVFNLKIDDTDYFFACTGLFDKFVYWELFEIVEPKIINKIGFKPVEQDDEYNEKLKNLESFLFDNFNLSQYQDENEDSSYFFFDADFWMNINANHDISFKLEYSKNRSSTTNYKDIFSVIKDDKVIYFGFISQYNPNIGLIESSEIMLFEEVVFTDTIYI